MNAKQIKALELRKTDVQGAVKRMGGDEQLYISCLVMFMSDSALSQLNEAVELKQWDNAFTAAHALKGLAGNMGFIPLMHSTGQLIIMIRGGRIKEIGEYMSQVNSDYRDITDAIRGNFLVQDKKGD